MSDWFYQTLLRPLAFRLPAIAARDTMLSLLGTISAIPFGNKALELLGRSKPSNHLRSSILGMDFASPVGLGAGLDKRCGTVAAFTQLGVGFVEIGPVTTRAMLDDELMLLRSKDVAIEYRDEPCNVGGTDVRRKILTHKNLDVRIGARIANSPDCTIEQAALEIEELLDLFGQTADYIVLDTRWGPAASSSDEETRAAYITFVPEVARRLRIVKPLFVSVSPDLTDSQVTNLVEYAISAGFKGIVVTGGAETEDRRRLTGHPTYTRSVGLVSFLRLRWPMLTIIGSGGLIEPRDALDMLKSGANLVQLHSGIIYSGPGLPKRINEAATAYNIVSLQVEEHEHAARFPGPGWLWFAASSAALILLGAYTLFLYQTHPPTEFEQQFLNLSTKSFEHLNFRITALLHFNCSIASGAMIGIGLQNLFLSLNAVRAGKQWARQTYIIAWALTLPGVYFSLSCAFPNFIHWILMAIFVLAHVAGLQNNHTTAPRSWNIRNDLFWRLSLYGQLALIILGFLLTMDGLSRLGMAAAGLLSDRDLQFVHMSQKGMEIANKHLVPLINFSKLSEGGLFAANGVNLLLATLWGLKQAEKWLWLSMAVAGATVFSICAGVQLKSGYADVYQLINSPWAIALTLLTIGLSLTLPYMFKPPGRS